MFVMLFNLLCVLRKVVDPNHPQRLVSLEQGRKLFKVYTASFKNFKEKLFFVVPLDTLRDPNKGSCG